MNTIVSVDDIAARLNAVNVTPFDPAAADKVLDEIEGPMCELYEIHNEANTLHEYFALAELSGQVLFRVREERPWTLFTTCTGSSYVWVPGGESAALARFTDYLGSSPFRTCGQCGDTVWREETYGVPTPDTHTLDTEDNPVVIILDAA